MARLLSLAAALLLACLAAPAPALADLIGTADENGHQTGMDTISGKTFQSTGANGTDPFDPNNGLKPMIYDVDSASTQVAGDILITGSGADGIDDLLRFTNDPTTGHGLLVVYSDIEAGDHDLADVGMPTSRQMNPPPLTFVEMSDPSGSGDMGLFGYTPTSTQPGFQPGIVLHINFISDAVPEPASAALVVAGAVLLLLCRGRIAALMAPHGGGA